MEMNSHDVTVVSAFGRSDWLAVELKALGMSVRLIDVTSQLGNWPPEDMEGPFGLFMLEKYQQSFLEFLSNQDKYTAVDNGFTIWSAEGPLEMKSTVTEYRFAQMGLHPKVWQALHQFPLGGDIDKSEFSAMSFSEIWPLCLSYQVASTTYHSNREALGQGHGRPLFNTFLVRHGTRGGLGQSLNWVRSHSVDVTSKTEILDVALAGRKQVTGFELKGELSGFHKFEHLVWGLTSEETYYLNERIAKKIFPQGPVESTWSWMRFRLQVQPCLEIQMMPTHVCLIEDIMAPWTHENLCLIHKTPVSENIDAWIRLPTVQRFNKEYLKNMGERVVRLFTSRMPLSEATVQAYPQEHYYTFKELGAPRFPIFEAGDAASRRYTFFNNLHRDGTEVWSNFTKDSQYYYQVELRDRIFALWEQKRLKQRIKESET